MILASLSILLMLSCQPSDNTSTSKSTTLLKSLKDYESKNQFLEQIYTSDQNIRKNAQLLNHGTKEHSEFWKKANL